MPKTILCVDDHEPALTVLGLMLKQAGYEVIATTSPAKALIVATTGHDIDLVITDFTMPKMSGGELIQEIRYLRPHMPIILLTGSFSALSGFGADLYIPKADCEPEVFLQHIKKLIQGGSCDGNQRPNRSEAPIGRTGGMSSDNPRMLQRYRRA